MSHAKGLSLPSPPQLRPSRPTLDRHPACVENSARAVAMAWQPAPESLRQLASCLKDSLSGFDKNAQKQAEVVRPLPSARCDYR